jgi:hypothetical protein
LQDTLAFDGRRRKPAAAKAASFEFGAEITDMTTKQQDVNYDDVQASIL